MDGRRPLNTNRNLKIAAEDLNVANFAKTRRRPDNAEEASPGPINFNPSTSTPDLRIPLQRLGPPTRKRPNCCRNGGTDFAELEKYKELVFSGSLEGVKENFVSFAECCAYVARKRSKQEVTDLNVGDSPKVDSEIIVIHDDSSDDEILRTPSSPSKLISKLSI